MVWNWREIVGRTALAVFGLGFLAAAAGLARLVVAMVRSDTNYRDNITLYLALGAVALLSISGMAFYYVIFKPPK